MKGLKAQGVVSVGYAKDLQDGLQNFVAYQCAIIHLSKGANNKLKGQGHNQSM